MLNYSAYYSEIISLPLALLGTIPVGKVLTHIASLLIQENVSVPKTFQFCMPPMYYQGVLCIVNVTAWVINNSHFNSVLH